MTEAVQGSGGGGKGSVPMGKEELEGVLREAQRALRELEAEGGSLEAFRGEFSKLVVAMERAHENEETYAARAAELADELDKCRRSRDETQQEKEELEAARTQLQEEISSALEDVTNSRLSAQEREADIRRLRVQLSELRAEIERGPGWSGEQKEEESALLGERDRLHSVLESRRLALESAREEEKVLREHLANEQERRRGVEAKLSEMAEEISGRRRDAQRLQAKKDEADRELQRLQDESERLASQVRTATEDKVARAAEVRRAEKEMRARRAEIEELVRQIERLRGRVDKLRDEVDTDGKMNEALAKELNEMEDQLLDKDRECEILQKQAAKFAKKAELAKAKSQAEDDRLKDAVERERELLEEQNRLDAECAEQTEATKGLERELEKRHQERAVLQRAIATKATGTRAVSTLVSVREAAASHVGSETAAAKRALRALRDRIEILKEERARYAKLVEAQREKYYAILESSKEKEVRASAAHTKLAELTAKLRKEQHNYETMRAERNAYSKSLVTAESEIAGMKSRFESLTYEIEQSKDEIMSMNQLLVREHFTLQKLRKDIERWTGELGTVQKQVQSSEHILAAQDREVRKLRAIVKEAEDEKMRQEKEYNAVISERDVLNAQLVRRDAELAELYERIRAQKAALTRGAEQFERKRAEVEAAERHLADLQAEAKLAQASVGNVEDLEKEAKRLEADLVRERAKAQALTDELKRPVNVHRWRALQVTDPERYKLIKRVAALQKRAVEAQQEMEEKDSKIAEKEKLYAELKEVLARQPGAEVIDQIEAYEANVKEKRKQLAALRAELEGFKRLVDEHRRAIQRTQEQIDHIEDEWVRNVRNSERRREKELEAQARDAMLGSMGLGTYVQEQEQEPIDESKDHEE